MNKRYFANNTKIILENYNENYEMRVVTKNYGARAGIRTRVPAVAGLSPTN